MSLLEVVTDITTDCPRDTFISADTVLIEGKSSFSFYTPVIFSYRLGQACNHVAALLFYIEYHAKDVEQVHNIQTYGMESTT